MGWQKPERRRSASPNFQFTRHQCTNYSNSSDYCAVHVNNRFFKMASKPFMKCARPQTFPFVHVKRSSAFSQPSYCRNRLFSSSNRLYQQRPNYKDSFGSRLRKALGGTKIKWYPIPAVLGIGFLGLGQLYRVNEREKARLAEEGDNGFVNSKGTGNGTDELDSRGRPKRGRG